MSQCDHIGLLPQAQYQTGRFELQRGDVIVLYTDGVSESMNAEDEEWGEESLIACAKTCCDLSARDMTLMVIRVVP